MSGGQPVSPADPVEHGHSGELRYEEPGRIETPRGSLPQRGLILLPPPELRERVIVSQPERSRVCPTIEREEERRREWTECVVYEDRRWPERAHRDRLDRVTRGGLLARGEQGMEPRSGILLSPSVAGVRAERAARGSEQATMLVEHGSANAAQPDVDP